LLLEPTVHLRSTNGNISVADLQGVGVSAAADVVNLQNANLGFIAANADCSAVGFEYLEFECSVECSPVVNTTTATAIPWFEYVIAAASAFAFGNATFGELLHRFDVLAMTAFTSRLTVPSRLVTAINTDTSSFTDCCPLSAIPC